MNLADPKDYQKLFLDMDSFFASVEEQVQPPLRNLPLAVAPYTGSSGCIISPSKKAKQRGVKTGMSVSEAKKICPKLMILPSRPLLYQLYHKDLVKVLTSFSPYMRVLSVDEMAISLDSQEQDSQKAQNLAREIKKRISQQVGDWLTCSVGIGPNQFLAKVAAERGKPDGLTLITLTELINFYQKLNLLDLPGINIRMKIALKSIGIDTPLDFYQSQMSALEHFFHYPGKLWYLRLRGFEVDDWQSQTQSIGHSFVLPLNLRHRQGVRKTVLKLSSKVAFRLRQDHFQAGALSLTVSFFDHSRIRKFSSFAGLADTFSLTERALYLLDLIDLPSTPIQVYVVAFKLSQGGVQSSLFPKIQKKVYLTQAIDKINDRFGPGTIHLAEVNDQQIAPDRIPFGPVRYEIRE